VAATVIESVTVLVAVSITDTAVVPSETYEVVPSGLTATP
jgi:hypothetical protein